MALMFKGEQIEKIVINKVTINQGLLNDNQFYLYFEMPLILKEFLLIYSEFKPVINSIERVREFLVLTDKIKCLYSEFKDLTKCGDKYPFYALLAHYAVTQGLGISIGLNVENGVLAGASVGDVSVSYQAAPYGANGDNFTYFLSTTKYGREYLAWLQRQAGLIYVN